ncbi:MAG: MBL fold metallo-hydrolase [Planctomycetota bacterium]
MRIRLWGVRGSVATPLSNEQLRDKQRALLRSAAGVDLDDPAAIDAYLDASEYGGTHGGNTSCVEVAFEDAVFVLDAGTGIRALGAELMRDGRGSAMPIHCFFTHFHWDHICGFPFFAPIYQPERQISIWSGRSDAGRLLAGQMNDAYFPVKWDRIPARIDCVQLHPDAVQEVAGAEVRILPMLHPDKAYGYRIERGGRALCYLTDTEISKDANRLERIYADFVEGSDVVIVDAMYGFLEYHEHVNFGHSNIFNWIDFFRGSRIGELVIFHHDPLASDEDIHQLCTASQRYRELVAPEATWRISAAREGMRWDLPPIG